MVKRAASGKLCVRVNAVEKETGAAGLEVIFA